MPFSLITSDIHLQPDENHPINQAFYRFLQEDASQAEACVRMTMNTKKCIVGFVTQSFNGCFCIYQNKGVKALFNKLFLENHLLIKTF